MSAATFRLQPDVSKQATASNAANAWILKNHRELVSRAAANLSWLNADHREEAVAEVVAMTLLWAHSAARRGALHRMTVYWAVVYASRQYLQGRRVAGSTRGCVMAELTKNRHRFGIASLDEKIGNGDSRSHGESLADRDAEDPFDVVRRRHDYPAIFTMESVSAKVIATFHYLIETKGEGPKKELAVELGVTGARVTQMRHELANALARHDYQGPLGFRPASHAN